MRRSYLERILAFSALKCASIVIASSPRIKSLTGKHFFGTFWRWRYHFVKFDNGQFVEQQASDTIIILSIYKCIYKCLAPLYSSATTSSEYIIVCTNIFWLIIFFYFQPSDEALPRFTNTQVLLSFTCYLGERITRWTWELLCALVSGNAWYFSYHPHSSPAVRCMCIYTPWRMPLLRICVRATKNI